MIDALLAIYERNLDYARRLVADSPAANAALFSASVAPAPA